jgi:small conductance mechanosensitive channel
VLNTFAITPLNDLGVWLRGNFLEIILFVLGAVLLSRLAAFGRDRFTEHFDAPVAGDAVVRSEETKHRRALAEIIAWVFTVLLWIVAVVLVANRFGIPFASLVAPLTAGGVALGLGAQRLVQDLIGGTFIVAERQYGYGDLVTIAGTPNTDGATGTVEDITLRVTRLRTANGELVVIPNGSVMQVTNLSNEWARAVVDVPLPVGRDVRQANDLLRKVGGEAYADDQLRALLLDEPTVMGVESLEVGQTNLRMVARTLPGRQFDVERELRVRIAEAFQEEDADA